MAGLIGLGGCGGDGNGDENLAVPEGCPSAAAVTEVVGVEVLSAGGSSGTGRGDGFETASDGCVYGFGPADAVAGTVPGAVPAGDEATVRVNRVTSESPDLYRLITDGARDPGFRGAFEPVGGLGDDARLDGDQVVVMTAGAIMFVRIDRASGSSLDPIAAATALAAAAVPLGLRAGPALDCAALAPVVTDVVGPLSSTSAAAPSPVSSQEGVGGVDLPAAGCRFDLTSGDLARVLVADPGVWPAWVRAKEQSPGRFRVVDVTVAGLPAVQVVGALVVDDAPEVLLVETYGVPGGDADLDRARVALAELVLG